MAEDDSKKQASYSEATMVSKMLATANISTPPYVAQALQQAAPALKVAGKVVNLVGPFYM